MSSLKYPAGKRFSLDAEGLTADTKVLLLLSKRSLMLIAHPKGHYHFLQGIDPYSCGVIADPGYEIVHVTLAQALPWRAGFDRVEAHLSAEDRDRYALCGMELRSPEPFTMQGFIDFNREYCTVLQEWDLYVGNLNPVARTNVAPFHDSPAEPVLHAFSYVIPNDQLDRKTLIVAGAGELREGLLVNEGIIRPGDTSPESMREKAAYVMQVMDERLAGLGGSWDLIDAVDVYTIYPLEGILEDILLPPIGPARRHGIRWHYTRPPIVDIDFEMDLHGIVSERIL